jgi:hypothetical protein
VTVPFLGDARRAAEALMVDAVSVSRRGGGTVDDLTGAVTGGATSIYTGRAKVQQSTAGVMGARVDAGELSTILLRLEVHLPVVGSEGVARGDVVTVTAATHDTALVGRTFVVHDLAFKTFATARRLGVEEAT